jgi:hypothetical protein
MLRFFLLAFFSLFSYSLALAQIPFYTQPDTAEMRAMREKNVRRLYRIDQPYDSVKGKLLKRAPRDTVFSEFDRAGHTTVSSYKNRDGTRAYSCLYFNASGQAVRRFSYDTDSTNGFLDYWTYNDKGQVIQEISCTREGAKDEPYAVTAFEYNDSGQLILQNEYYLAEDQSKDLSRSTVFLYAEKFVVEITLLPDGDSMSIDTIAGRDSDDPYWARRYRYESDDDASHYLILLSESKITADTTGGRVREIYVYSTYDYGTGAQEAVVHDTTYYDTNGKVVEIRDDRHIQRYVYRKDGTFDHMICYNRQMQPLYRRTEAYEFYK